MQHCNKKDYWVVTHTLFSDTFYVYLVNALGVQAPQKYKIGSPIGDGIGWSGTGYLKFSPDGSRLVNVMGPAVSGLTSNADLLYFNNKTGIVNGPVTTLSNLNFPYGAEFSQSNRLLYIAENNGQAKGQQRILQYDLTAANIATSQYVVAQSPTLRFGALQLGPDNKIYAGVENGYNNGYGFLGRINNPEVYGSGCGYVQDAVYLNGKSTLIGLPTFAATFLKKDSSAILASVSCVANPVQFNIANTNNVDSVKWNFGDGGPGSTGLSPQHKYSSAGIYNLSLILYKSCNNNDTITKPLSIGSCTVACPQPSDFSFSFEPCNPLSVQLATSATGYTTINWQFGDGNTVLAASTLAHSYAAAGTYPVKMIVTKPGCTDTVSKNITIGVSPADIIQTPDTVICSGSSKQLKASPALKFCWLPTTYLDNPNTPNPVSKPAGNITYYYTAEITGNNLIPNGDFSQGNTGFTSDYRYTTRNSPGDIGAGEYTVGTNPQAWNPGMYPCKDHTTGSSNMMIVKGASVVNVKVWGTSITVSPNTNYAFSCWVQSLWWDRPARLQFFINGQLIDTVFQATSTTCLWQQFYTIWNSGSNAKADIAIINQNTAIGGNDFALDDISFAPLFIQRDSVTLTVEKPMVTARPDTTVCAGSPVQLQANGAASYTWTPSTGLSATTTSNPVASPAASTKYFVTGTTARGCFAKDSVAITVRPVPQVNISKDTTICHNNSVQLRASGGGSYVWQPAASLDNPGIANPVASPLTNTRYRVTVTGSNNCSSSDSVMVSVIPSPTFSVSGDRRACAGPPVPLKASGGDRYSWSPATGLDNPSANNPMASPVTTTTYTVKIVQQACMDSAQLATTVTVLPAPTVRAIKSNDINCTTPSARFTATGAESYFWTPAAGLNNPTIANPIATPDSNTTYVVKGSTADGCSGYDSVVIKVTDAGKIIFELPNAFTPNNDGNNDCFGVKRYAELLRDFDFSIYNRFGQRVFHTTNPAACWDGTYQGKLQDPGGFVYIIKASSLCGTLFRKGMVMLVR